MSIRRFVIRSASAFRRYVGIGRPTARSVIGQFYEAVLCREADESELSSWEQRLESGATLSDVWQGIYSSSEARLQRQSALASTVGRPMEISRVRLLVSLFYEAILNRMATPLEVEHWIARLAKGGDILTIWNAIRESIEAESDKTPSALPSDTATEIIISGYELILGRGVAPREFERWHHQLTSGVVTESAMATSLFKQRRNEIALRDDVLSHRQKPAGHSILGRDVKLTSEEWNRRGSVTIPATCLRSTSFGTQLQHPSNDDIRVSILASMYSGRCYIEQYLANITEQTVFNNMCELIIVDACSPENEIELIQPYIYKYPGRIIYKRLPYRATIYEAWNEAIGLARGEYLTNANLDDTRRQDSIEIQVNALDALPFVDIVYQDVLYTLDSSLPYSEIAKRNVLSDLPIVNRQNIVEFNSPHNGPMWRHSVHNDVGLFNGAFRSAGDWDFWMRCVLAGKRFYKLNDPHIAYFVNPDGLSTSIGGVGLEEGRAVQRAFARRLLPSAITEEFSLFTRRCGHTRDTGRVSHDRYQYIQSLLLEAAHNAE